MGGILLRLFFGGFIISLGLLGGLWVGVCGYELVIFFILFERERNIRRILVRFLGKVVFSLLCFVIV